MTAEGHTCSDCHHSHTSSSRCESVLQQLALTLYHHAAPSQRCSITHLGFRLVPQFSVLMKRSHVKSNGKRMHRVSAPQRDDTRKMSNLFASRRPPPDSTIKVFQVTTAVCLLLLLLCPPTSCTKLSHVTHSSISITSMDVDDVHPQARAIPGWWNHLCGSRAAAALQL